MPRSPRHLYFTRLKSTSPQKSRSWSLYTLHFTFFLQPFFLNISLCCGNLCINVVSCLKCWVMVLERWVRGLVTLVRGPGFGSQHPHGSSQQSNSSSKRANIFFWPVNGVYTRRHSYIHIQFKNGISSRSPVHTVSPFHSSSRQ